MYLSKAKAVLVKDFLAAAPLAGSSYLLLISPKYSRAESRPHLKAIIAASNPTAVGKSD